MNKGGRTEIQVLANPLNDPEENQSKKFHVSGFKFQVIRNAKSTALCGWTTNNQFVIATPSTRENRSGMKKGTMNRITWKRTDCCGLMPQPRNDGNNFNLCGLCAYPERSGQVVVLKTKQWITTDVALMEAGAIHPGCMVHGATRQLYTEREVILHGSTLREATHRFVQVPELDRRNTNAIQSVQLHTNWFWEK